MNAVNAMMDGLEANFSWVYVIGMTLFVFFCLLLAICPLGKRRLGDDDGKPEYGLFSWFAMLFAAGMGVGLVFWGVAEPLSHYIAPMAGFDPMTEAAQGFSFRSVFMHWGLHPWACYAVVGLGMAYFLFRRKKPALISNVLEPLIGRFSQNAVGKGIDVYVTVLTIVGVSTSFGMGTLQVASGLEYLFGIPSGIVTWGVLILIIGVIFVWSAVAGIDRGIKYVSNTNIVLAIVLMVVCFFIGSQFDMIRNFAVGLFDYVVNFIPDSFRMSADNGDPSWILAWRVFYWAWWLSWAPFCGLFIARISKGRTIREFVLGVLLVPTLCCAIWFAVFGTIGVDAASFFTAEQLAEIVAKPETALFIVFSNYPLGAIISVIAMIVVTLFFITSANSATFVLGMLTSYGSLEPKAGKKLVWGILLMLMSFMMVVTGGTAGMQTMAIVIAFPFFFIATLMCISFVKVLREDHRADKARLAQGGKKEGADSGSKIAAGAGPASGGDIG